LSPGKRGSRKGGEGNGDALLFITLGGVFEKRREKRKLISSRGGKVLNHGKGRGRKKQQKRRGGKRTAP